MIPKEGGGSLVAKLSKPANSMTTTPWLPDVQKQSESAAQQKRSSCSMYVNEVENSNAKTIENRGVIGNNQVDVQFSVGPYCHTTLSPLASSCSANLPFRSKRTWRREGDLFHVPHPKINMTSFKGIHFISHAKKWFYWRWLRLQWQWCCQSTPFSTDKALVLEASDNMFDSSPGPVTSVLG